MRSLQQNMHCPEKTAFGSQMGPLILLQVAVQRTGKLTPMICREEVREVDFSEDAVQDGTETDTSGTAPGRPTPPEKPDGENRPDLSDQGQKDESGINAQEKMSFSSASTAWMPPIIPRPEDLG